ncbi:putative carboxylesterase 120 [Citrus sinensis]|uniref:carboxylesterase 1-like n=1 Tax=Citrus sinensis TaxID=2711 RepID=UPI000CED4F34|nr:carboxylesterase 1-like [Citrus sinensis]XP_024039469.1 carboxylesterase 1 [Citrus x clementina]KAH9647369.1 putative carboxylesterase 120 [Citrus sinensis]
MSDTTALCESTTDFPQHPMFTFNSDGTMIRNHSLYPNTAATPDPNDDTIALSKDVPVNQSNNTWVRIFLPRQALDSSTDTKFPLVVYTHGGGLLLLSAATKIYHDLCSEIAARVPAIIVSVDYRLAPEHRLPAAYDDAVEVLQWVKTTQEHWLRQYADFSSCFIMGDSGGGNIAYHAALQAAAQVDDLLPLKIKGLILLKPFFGGVKRTESELRLANQPILPPPQTDFTWQLALPIGADRDHEYSNPIVGGGSKFLDQFRLLGWKVMVTGGSEDTLFDRQVELAKLMEQKGVNVVSYFDDSPHDMIGDPVKLEALYVNIKKFILS